MRPNSDCVDDYYVRTAERKVQRKGRGVGVGGLKVVVKKIGRAHV